ncbi:ABC transporter ATP-binding protein [Fulvivirgaceae bacterium BMA10]|uniref:ABC transporter ATP-binding protein n=1 Tax=Splendidivirga corallicola TaxID=3051826 RepID=A0ABT8KJF4_9BACT|nr:ABC transporter ATP-binding protein [Fulvivirgaceae bacterium BMA10]
MNNQKEIIIAVEQVKKYFKEVKAVDGIDLKIHAGEYVALLGPNGAGKTTLVEMIEGIQQPNHGKISIKGKNWKHHQDELHRIIGLSLQETRFIDKLSVLETLNLFAGFYGLSKGKVSEILDLVNLEEKKKTWVVNLSGGQRQRLALGIALLNDPEILLLDEPTTGLDPTARREVWDILMKLKNERNTTMILTTHYMEEASYLCEKIVIMHSGKILAQGTLDELLSKHVKGEAIDFALDRSISKDDLPKTEKVIKIDYDEDNLNGEIIVEDLVSYLPKFLDVVKQNNLNLTSLECRKMTLDDLFISMTGRHLND